MARTGLNLGPGLRPRTLVLSLVSLAAFLAGCGVAIETGLIVHRTTVAVPFADHWDILREFFATRSDVHDWASFLWRQHNEHRIPLLRLLLAADVVFERARGSWLLTVTWLVQALHAGLFAWVLRRLGGASRTTVVGVSGISLLFLFHPAQADNFWWTFQVGFVLAFLIESAAIVALALAIDQHRQGRGRESGWSVALAATCGTLAVGSLANGLLLWPILLVMAIAGRLPWRWVAGLALVGVLLWVAYFVGYSQPGQHAVPLKTLRDPRTLDYVAVYLLNGLGVAQSARAPGLILASLGLLGIVLGRGVLTGRERSTTLLFACVGLLGVGTAWATALGRLNLGIGQAGASRYQTPAMLFWLAICLLAVELVRQSETKVGRWFGVAAVAVAGLTVGLAGRQVIPAYGTALEAMRTVRLGAFAVAVHVGAEADMRRLGHVGDVVKVGSDELRKRDVSLFAGHSEWMLGGALWERYPTITGQCAGEFESAESVGRESWAGYRLHGWSWDGARGAEFQDIVVADGAGRIVGLGTSHTAHPARAEGKDGWMPVLAGWTAYAPASAARQSVQVFAVSGPRSVCRLGGLSRLD